MYNLNHYRPGKNKTATAVSPSGSSGGNLFEQKFLFWLYNNFQAIYFKFQIEIFNQRY